MQRTLPLILVISLFLPVPLRSQKEAARKEYRLQNGNRVVIFAILKRTSEPTYLSHESRLEFYSPDNELLCALDYSSEDHEHGFGVVKAAWTSDNDYFVFSLTSSGGHQAWHAPTLFYSARDHEIRSLDNYVAEGVGISKADFTLRPPNVVMTEVWRGESVPAKFRLDSLMNASHKARNSSSCSGGKVLRPER